VLVECSPDCVAVHWDGRVLYANPASLRLLGIESFEQLRGTSIIERIHPDDRELVAARLRQVAAGERSILREIGMLTMDGRTVRTEVMSALITYQGKPAIQTILRDVTDRQRAEQAMKEANAELARQVAEVQLNESRMEAVLELSHMTDAPLHEITDFALEQAVALTKSRIGYVAVVNEDETTLTMLSWSKTAMDQCAIDDKPIVYPVATTGLWGEAVRQRQPIITNDYAAPNPWKKGAPVGHVSLSRHMNVPIFDGGRIVIVVGVGNKEEEYDNSDVRQLELLMGGMWTLIQRQRAQAELRQHRDHLEQLVHERTAALSIANEELQREIQERRRGEEALRQSHDELRAIYDQAVDGILIADAERGGIVRANSAYCRMLGYSEAEVGSLSSEQVHPPEVMPKVWDHFAALKRGVAARLEDLPFLRRDGGVVFADVVSRPIYYDQRSCWISFFRDITERKRAEQALVESEAKYRQLVEITDTGYAILDAQGRIADANREYVRLSGHRDLKDILGRSAVEWTAPHDLQRNAREVAKCVETGHVRQLEIDYVRPDGGVTPVEINAACIDTPQGKRILALHRDISERRQAQAALERERQTLKHLLQSSDHERQLIAYEIHDGLAQYLAGSIMQFEVYDHLKQTKPKEAARAYDAGMTMLHQSHADARRLISGVRPPILDEEGIASALTHLVNEHRRKKGPKIEFYSDVEFDRLVPLLENAVYRIANEGLTNACRHSKSKRVRVDLVQHGHALRIAIQDWGTGFDPGKVEENRFGLAGMRERARLLGGSIRIDSTPGQGTCITAELPLLLKE
jgi:PAS domain S-box-containing protein